MRRTCRVAVAGPVGCVLAAAAGVVLMAPGIARAASAVPDPGHVDATARDGIVMMDS